jgi:hypothetical protein
VRRDARHRPKNGSQGAVYLYHVADNERTMRVRPRSRPADHDQPGGRSSAAATWQGWRLSPESFDAVPFLDLLADYGEPHGMVEGDPRRG